MKTLITFFEQCLKLMNEHQGEDYYNIRNAFYQQAFGAATYETYKAIETGKYERHKEVEALWEEWKPKFEAALWGE